MIYPELYSDERIILRAQNVKVKSILLEAVLTTHRLILIDPKKNSIPPQEINLATLKNLETGENAISDPTITVSIIPISGNPFQVVLTFSKNNGGERRRECDEWARTLRQSVPPTVPHPVTQTAPRMAAKSAPESQTPVPHPVTQTAPRMAAKSAPESQTPVPHPVTQTAPRMAAKSAPESQTPVPHPVTQAAPRAAMNPAPESQTPVSRRGEIPHISPSEKRDDIPRPIIVESAAAMPVHGEPTSIPTGLFCNRCGNRLPPESAFCNRCGTPIVQIPGSEDLPPVEVGIPQEQSASSLPRVQVPTSPSQGAVADKKDRSIEEIIYSIKPLIEDWGYPPSFPPKDEDVRP